MKTDETKKKEPDALTRKRKELRMWHRASCTLAFLFIFLLLVSILTLLDYFGVITELFGSPRKTGFDAALSAIWAIMILGIIVRDRLIVRRLRREIHELEQRTEIDKQS